MGTRSIKFSQLYGMGLKFDRWAGPLVTDSGVSKVLIRRLGVEKLNFVLATANMNCGHAGSSVPRDSQLLVVHVIDRKYGTLAATIRRIERHSFADAWVLHDWCPFVCCVG